MSGEGVHTFTETEIIDSSRPLDLSFKKFKILNDMSLEGPSETRIGAVPERGAVKRKFLSRSVWLNHNKINNLKGLDVTINSVLEQPERLSWLDLSFNFISQLDEVLLQFKNLKILYLHGNLLDDIDQTLMLRDLTEMRTLTFQGNPMTYKKDYRLYIVFYLPQVLNLDFSPVTSEERTWPYPCDAKRRMALYDKNKKKDS